MCANRKPSLAHNRFYLFWIHVRVKSHIRHIHGISKSQTAKCLLYTLYLSAVFISFCFCLSHLRSRLCAVFLLRIFGFFFFAKFYFIFSARLFAQSKGTNVNTNQKYIVNNVARIVCVLPILMAIEMMRLQKFIFFYFVFLRLLFSLDLSLILSRFYCEHDSIVIIHQERIAIISLWLNCLISGFLVVGVGLIHDFSIRLALWMMCALYTVHGWHV